MALNFPTSPSLNQTYTVGTKTWKWNGYAWDVQVTTGGGADSASVIAAFATANTALSIANSAFAQANTGGAAATESLNVNFQHVVAPVLGPLETMEGTFTHSARVLALNTGDIIGFRASATGARFTINNGSLILTKLSA